MKIPKTVRIGSVDYDVKDVDHEMCVDGKSVCGRITYNESLIEIRTDGFSQQSREITLLHEMVHAISRERGLDWGDNDELYTEELAKSLHQIIKDNPDILK
jgi:hypothetical protein